MKTVSFPVKTAGSAPDWICPPKFIILSAMNLNFIQIAGWFGVLKNAGNGFRPEVPR